ncbi:hypothetical protein BGLA2_1740013 [Burkholderia gladioli]|nr:hypothetical protein BGLA2_1740013 [Burkholderia gladioli]
MHHCLRVWDIDFAVKPHMGCLRVDSPVCCCNHPGTVDLKQLDCIDDTIRPHQITRWWGVGLRPP